MHVQVHALFVAKQTYYYYSTSNRLNNNSPPNLVAVEVDDANSFSQILKLNATKCLGQNICELVFCADVLDRDSSILNAVPDVVVPRVDVLATVMVHWILAQLDRRLIVHKQISDERSRSQQVAEQTAEPNTLTRRRRSCDVLRLAG